MTRTQSIGIEVLHDHVGVLAGHVGGDEAKQHPCWTIMLRTNVGLEGVEDGVVDLAILGPGVAGPGQVVGHVVGLHLSEDDPWQGVVGGGGLLGRDKVTKQAVPDTLQHFLTGFGFHIQDQGKTPWTQVDTKLDMSG